MVGLLFLLLLSAASVALAQRLGLLSEVLALVAASILGGALTLALNPDLAWVAVPKGAADASCGAGEDAGRGDVVEPGGSAALASIDIIAAGEEMAAARALFIDARPREAYLRGHIPGALSLASVASSADGGGVDVQALPIPAGGQVVLYCEAERCAAAEQLGAQLRRTGQCQQLSLLEGGWRAWTAAGADQVAGEEPQP